MKIVTPEADEDGDRRVVAGAQYMTMNGFLQLLDEPNHVEMRDILKPCRYENAWLK